MTASRGGATIQAHHRAVWQPSPRRPPKGIVMKARKEKDIGLPHASRERAPIEEPILGTRFDAGVPSASRDDEGGFRRGRSTDDELPLRQKQERLAPGTRLFHGKSLPQSDEIGRPADRVGRGRRKARGERVLEHRLVWSLLRFQIYWTSSLWASLCKFSLCP